MTLIRHNCRTLVCSVGVACMAWHAGVTAQTAPVVESAQSSSAAPSASPQPTETAVVPVAVAPGASASEPSVASQPACLPTCRAGFTCIAGSCVSACNPPCDAGEFCTKDGECRAKAVQTQQPASEQKSPTNSAKATKVPVDNTHTNNPAMLIGGMVLTSVGAFVGGLGYLRINRDKSRCDSGLTEWCSTSKSGIALITAGGVMAATGIPFIILGARRVPNRTQTSWEAPPEAARLTLSVGPGSLALSGAF